MDYGSLSVRSAVLRMLVGLGLVLEFCCQTPCAATTAKFNKSSRLYEDVVIAVPRAQDTSTELELQLHNFFGGQASELLCNATNGRAAFGNVTLLLPRNDNMPADRWSSWQRLSSADLRMGLGGSLPISVQSRGCGKTGDYIYVTPEFASNIQNRTEAKHFLALWFQHRYGVFPEISDGLWFDVRNKEFAPNACTNKPLRYTLENIETPVNSANCVDLKTGALDHECVIKLNSEENSNVTSSLLSHYEWPNVVDFCNKSTHNQFAATPQNLICGYRSVWEVVEEHVDFTDSNNGTLLDCANLPEVNLNIVYSNCHHLHVLVALNESNEEYLTVLRYAKEAVFDFIYNLAEENLNMTFYSGSEAFEPKTITIGQKRQEDVKRADAILDEMYRKKTVDVTDSPTTFETVPEVSTGSTAAQEVPTTFETVPEVSTGSTAAPEVPTTSQTTTSLPVKEETGFTTLGEQEVTTPMAEMTILPSELSPDKTRQLYRPVRDAENKNLDPCFDCIIRKISEDVQKGNPCDNTLLIITDFAQVLNSDSKSHNGTRDNANLANELRDGGIRVLTVAVNGVVDEEFESLSAQTFGRSYAARKTESDEVGSAILDALHDYSNADGDRFAMIDEKRTIKTNETTAEFEFKILPQEGIKTFQLQIRGSSNLTNLIWTNSDQTPTPFLESCFHYQELNTAYCTLKNNDNNNASAELHVSGALLTPGSVWLRVDGQIEATNQTAVILTSWLSNDNEKVNLTNGPLFVYARLTHHDFPVVDAEVKVLLLKPDGSHEERNMRDDGAGPDIIPNDGLYTGYFSLCQERGRYSFKVQATRKEQTRVKTDCSATAKRPCEVESPAFNRLAWAGSAFLDDCGNETHLTRFPVRNLRATTMNMKAVPYHEKFQINWTDTLDEQKISNAKMYIGERHDWPLKYPPISFTTDVIDRKRICKNGYCSTERNYDPDLLHEVYLVLVVEYRGSASTQAIFYSNVVTLNFNNISYSTKSTSTTDQTPFISTSNVTPNSTDSTSPFATDSTDTSTTQESSTPAGTQDGDDSPRKSTPVALIVSLVVVSLFVAGGVAFYFFYYRPTLSRRINAMSEHSVSYRSLE